MILVRKLVILLMPIALWASPTMDNINAIVSLAAEHAEDLTHVEYYLKTLALINKSDVVIDSILEKMAQAKSARVVRQADWLRLQNAYSSTEENRESHEAVLKSINKVINSRSEITRLKLVVAQQEKELAAEPNLIQQ